MHSMSEPHAPPPALTNTGLDPSLPETRLYATHEAQPWHNDISDLVSLLCLKSAREGGHSSWASSVSVHNEVVRRAPHLARALAAPNAWFYDRKGGWGGAGLSLTCGASCYWW